MWLFAVAMWVRDRGAICVRSPWFTDRGCAREWLAISFAGEPFNFIVRRWVAGRLGRRARRVLVTRRCFRLELRAGPPYRPWLLEE